MIEMCLLLFYYWKKYIQGKEYMKVIIIIIMFFFVDDNWIYPLCLKKFRNHNNFFLHLMMHLRWKEKHYFTVLSRKTQYYRMVDSAMDVVIAQRFKNGDGRNFAYVEKDIHTHIDTKIFLVWHLKNATLDLFKSWSFFALYINI